MIRFLIDRVEEDILKVRLTVNDPELAHGETQGEVLEEHQLAEPMRYKVLLHNDDFTTQEFVVAILCAIFHKDIEEATTIMLHVHNHGIGECGVFTQEVAEGKVARVRREARRAGFPLRCTMEEM